MIITIDGPAASGKSTIARLLAQELHYYYLCSGLLFRAVAYILINKYGYSLEQLYNPSVADIEQLLHKHHFVYCYKDGKEQVIFDNNDITPYLKEATIDQASSIISLFQPVRDYLLIMQREIAANHNVVVEGRDAGSVVFPHAEYKFYIVAQVSIRAQRWLLSQQYKGKKYTKEQALHAIQERDTRDMVRTNAPLQKTEDAHSIDTSSLTPQASVQLMRTYIQ